jgi:hypothetical protein
MYKYFKEHADNSERIIEFGEHLKNGANPENRQSKENILMSDKGTDVKQNL